MELQAIIDFAEVYNSLSWSVQEQLVQLVAEGEGAELNANAVMLMKNLLPALGRIDADAEEELRETIEQWESFDPEEGETIS